LLGIRALIRRSIPATERELKETAASTPTLSALIQKAKHSRRDPGFWPAKNMSGEDSNVYSGMCSFHEQIIQALRAGLSENAPVSAALESVIRMLERVEKDLSNDEVTL
jgi:hypothetical protein